MHAQHVQDMVTFSGVSLESEVGGILVRSVVPQSELDCTAVHTRAQTVGTREPVQPSNTTKELALDGAGTLRVRVALVQENRVS